VLKFFGLDHFVKYDIGELIAYITLTAKSLGVDSIVIGWLDKEKLLKAIGAGEGEDCSLVVALGYSDSPLRKKDRRSDEEVIKYI
jgi:nitroreductase